MLSTCWQPQSRGTVRLAGKHPQKMPLINPEYLKEDVDVDCIVRAIRLAERLIATNSFQSIGAKIHWPRHRSCEKFGPFMEDAGDDGVATMASNRRYLECIIRMVAVTSHHPGGTAAIGDNEQSVVDSRLR